MNQEHQTLAERRLLLLEEICIAADEISRIDNELKTDNKRRDSYEQRD